MPSTPTTPAGAQAARCRKTRPALWNREYEAREINRDGDAEDVHHFATEYQAVQEAHKLIEAGVTAVAVEYHETRFASVRSDRHETYTEIVAFGDADALAAFGWEGRVCK